MTLDPMFLWLDQWLDSAEWPIMIGLGYVIVVVGAVGIRIFFQQKRFLRALVAAEPPVTLPPLPPPGEAPPPRLRLERYRAWTPIRWRDRARKRTFRRNLSRPRHGAWGQLFRCQAALASAMVILIAAARLGWIDVWRPGWSSESVYGWLGMGFAAGMLFFLVHRGMTAVTLSHNRKWDDRLLAEFSFVFANSFFAICLFETLDAEILGAAPALALALVPFGAYFAAAPVFRMRPRGVGRTDLLMLRIFNTRKAGYLTEKIEPLWEYLGSTFAISSRDFFNLTHFGYDRGQYNRLMLRAVAPSVVAAAACSVGYAEGLLPAWLILLLALLHGWLASGPTTARVMALIRDSYVEAADAVDGHVDQLWGAVEARHGRPYVHRHLNCRGETWVHVVRHLVDRCDVVLLDFRGFERGNAGILYELGLVLGSMPVRRVLIVMDQRTREAPFLEAAQEVWSRVAEDSPDRSAPGPLKIYFVRRRIGNRAARRIASLLFRDAI